MDSLDDSSSDGSDDEAGDGGGNDEEGEEGATAVTRFLIKRLPKQLSKLRNDKAELEDRILDLEQTISNQNQAMLEMERRVDVYKKEAETARKWMASLSLNIGKVSWHLAVIQLFLFLNTFISIWYHYSQSSGHYYCSFIQKLNAVLKKTRLHFMDE